jgi:hypothetical protein
MLKIRGAQIKERLDRSLCIDMTSHNRLIFINNSHYIVYNWINKINNSNR